MPAGVTAVVAGGEPFKLLELRDPAVATLGFAVGGRAVGVGCLFDRGASGVHDPLHVGLRPAESGRTRRRPAPGRPPGRPVAGRPGPVSSGRSRPRLVYRSCTRHTSVDPTCGAFNPPQLFGAPGRVVKRLPGLQVGKTHVALGLGLAACQRGLSVGFTTAASLVHELNEAS